MNSTYRPTLIALTAACTLAVFAGLSVPAQAQEENLPDMGSSAASVITPSEEAQYGAMLMRELRRLNLLIEDPLVDSWLQTIGYRLAESSDKPEQSFTFFMMRDRQINAFATLGGHIGMNSGLVLTAEHENEVAGVMGHEIAHVTQRHVLRGHERQQRNQLPIMLGMLGVIAAASQSDSRSSDDAIQAAVVGGQALMQQLAINYTRSNESEADRIGIQTLARAGFDPQGIGDFFSRMERANRGNSGGYQVPDYLRTHPVTSTRVAEARDRAKRIAEQPVDQIRIKRKPVHPLLTTPLVEDDNAPESKKTPGNTGYFPWARERLRVFSASSSKAAVDEYQALARQNDGKLSPAQRYGYALALNIAGNGQKAAAELDSLLAGQPQNLWLRIARAEAEHQLGRAGSAREMFERLVKQYPNNRAVVLSYAQVLGEIGTADSGRRAQTILRPLLANSANDVVFQRRFARASELANDKIRASESWAEVAFLNGRAEDALNQLDNLKKSDDLDYIQRARIEARMAAITPMVLEMRRRGIRPGAQGSEGG